MNQDYESAENAPGSEQWVASFADGLYEEERDAVLKSIEQVERLDPGNRRLVWSGGIPLSFDESVEKNYRSSDAASGYDPLTSIWLA